MVFGTDKIPDIARGLGKGMRQIKDATNEIKKEINDSADKTKLDQQITSDVSKEINEVKDGIDNITGPIKRN
ncbi:MAG: twin-arginine translocase TatA/TatE family subunit [Polaribacter sp.]|nr:twin-arginine translocase TatA/TatE family subunit [Polaribacter sp.]